MPGLVCEFRISRDREDFGAKLLELLIVFLHLFELGRTDEGEIRWVEEHDRPLSTEIREVRLVERLLLIVIELEVRHLASDYREVFWHVGRLIVVAASAAAAAFLLVHKVGRK